jgi:chromosome segregation ATPase
LTLISVCACFSNDLSSAEAKRHLLEELTSRLAKENIKLEESKSKIDTDNTSLKNQHVTLSEDLSFHQKLLVQANQNTDSLNSRLQDQDSVILGLRACEAANESKNVDLGVLKLRIEQLEEKNLALETQNACTNLTLSECHLKIENLESKEKEMIRISTQDSDLARQLHDETLDLKETTRKVGANLEDVKQENSALRKDISSKEGQLTIAAGLEAQLKEKVQGLLEAVEQHGNNNKELQTRLDCTQTKWEDSKGQENLLMGQAKILRENFNEAQATQSVLVGILSQLPFVRMSTKPNLSPESRD